MDNGPIEYSYSYLPYMLLMKGKLVKGRLNKYMYDRTILKATRKHTFYRILVREQNGS